MLLSRRKPEHLCMVPRALSTVEHLGAMAEQAHRAGVETCWLDLGDQPGTSEALEHWTTGDRKLIRADDAKTLRRHLRRHRSIGAVIQTPYEEHYPDWFWTTTQGRLVYAGYGLTMSTWEAGLYALDTYQRCAWVITESEWIRERYIAHGVDPGRVLTAGNPLLYELRARLQNAPEPTVGLLWAPHWTEDWFGARGYSTWRTTVHVVLEYAESRSDQQVLLRPHPLLPAGVASADASDDDAAAYRRLVSLPNVAESSSTMLDDILHARALLTDGVSIIAYWATTGKPLGISRDAQSPAFNPAGEALVEVSECLESPTAIRAWLDRLDEAPGSAPLRTRSTELHPTGAHSPIEVLMDAVRKSH